jgi:hypothetical protein
MMVVSAEKERTNVDRMGQVAEKTLANDEGMTYTQAIPPCLLLKNLLTSRSPAH